MRPSSSCRMTPIFLSTQHVFFFVSIPQYTPDVGPIPLSHSFCVLAFCSCFLSLPLPPQLFSLSEFAPYPVSPPIVTSSVSSESGCSFCFNCFPSCFCWPLSPPVTPSHASAAPPLPITQTFVFLLLQNLQYPSAAVMVTNQGSFIIQPYYHGHS